MTRAWLFLALALLPLAAAADMPAPYTAQYEVRRNGERLGTGTVSFKALPNGRYELNSSTVGSEGLAAIAGVAIDERSVLRWTGQQPETVSYTYRQKVAWKSRERGFNVDAKAGRIESRDKDRQYSPPYQPGVLDRSAINVALMLDVAAGNTGDLKYLVPDKDELKTQVYRTAAPERLATALGQQRVIRVERIRESANGRSTTLWLGQDKKFIPLQILQKEPDGESIEMRIISIH
ncbi:MAG: DUF3108 domain-containing protein [Arenimonas sp.]